VGVAPAPLRAQKKAPGLVWAAALTVDAGAPQRRVRWLVQLLVLGVMVLRQPRRPPALKR
jgi:hypothetical protein